MPVGVAILAVESGSIKLSRDPGLWNCRDLKPAKPVDVTTLSIALKFGILVCGTCRLETACVMPILEYCRSVSIPQSGFWFVELPTLIYAVMGSALTWSRVPQTRIPILRDVKLMRSPIREWVLSGMFHKPVSIPH